MECELEGSGVMGSVLGLELSGRVRFLRLWLNPAFRCIRGGLSTLAGSRTPVLCHLVSTVYMAHKSTPEAQTFKHVP